MSEQLAIQRTIKMKSATDKLNSDGDTSTHRWDKALRYVNERNAKENKPPYQVDATQLLAVVEKMEEMNDALSEAHLKEMTIEYLMLLPADPYEAIYFDRQAVELAFSRQGKLQ